MQNTYNSTKDNQEKLYHREVFWLDVFDQQATDLIKDKELQYSLHLEENFILPTNDKHYINKRKLYHILNNFNTNAIKPFEVLVYNNKAVKAVVRTEYDETRDISIVLRNGRVVTAWLNNKNDIHKNLNNSKYMNEENKMSTFRANDYDVEQVTRYIYTLENFTPKTSLDNIIKNIVHFWELDHNDCINSEIPRHDINWYINNIVLESLSDVDMMLKI